MSPWSSNSSLCLTQRPAIGSTQGKHSTDSWKTVTKEDKDHEGDFLNEQYIRYFWVITLYRIRFWQVCFRLVVLPNLQGFTAKNFYILSPTAQQSEFIRPHHRLLLPHSQPDHHDSSYGVLLFWNHRRVSNATKSNFLIDIA